MIQRLCDHGIGLALRKELIPPVLEPILESKQDMISDLGSEYETGRKPQNADGISIDGNNTLTNPRRLCILPLYVSITSLHISFV
jgi:hypothetical protein